MAPRSCGRAFESAIYTLLLPFQIGDGTEANELLYLLLGSTSFGLTLVAILWYRRHVRSWRRAAALLTVVIAAHAAEPVVAVTGASFLVDVQVPFAGTVVLVGPIVMLIAAFVIVLGALIIMFPERRHILTPVIAAACAASVALAAAYLEAIQHGAWITFWNAAPLWLFWQTGIAAVAGIALWVADVALPPRRSSAERQEEGDRATLHCEGTPAPVVDVFFKAYLQKYPSSIERR